jgi:ankyrin repeat protein
MNSPIPRANNDKHWPDVSEWLQHAQDGNAAQLEAWLEDGYDINAQSNTGKSALLASVCGKKTSTALRLLALGANPNLANNDRAAPLVFAVASSNALLVRGLLACGADVNAHEG